MHAKKKKERKKERKKIIDYAMTHPFVASSDLACFACFESAAD